MEYKTTTKLNQSTLRWNHDTQFYRIKSGVGVPPPPLPPPPPSPITFERVDEIL